VTYTRPKHRDYVTSQIQHIQICRPRCFPLLLRQCLVVFMCRHRLHNMMLFYCDHRITTRILDILRSLRLSHHPHLLKHLQRTTCHLENHTCSDDIKEKKHTQHHLLSHPNQNIIINHTGVKKVWSHLSNFSSTCVHSPHYRVLTIDIELILTRAI